MLVHRLPRWPNIKPTTAKYRWGLTPRAIVFVPILGLGFRTIYTTLSSTKVNNGLQYSARISAGMDLPVFTSKASTRWSEIYISNGYYIHTEVNVRNGT